MLSLDTNDLIGGVFLVDLAGCLWWIAYTDNVYYVYLIPVRCRIGGDSGNNDAYAYAPAHAFSQIPEMVPMPPFGV